eukprot:6478729-Pyramimonas_sp.AAC.1
MSSTAVSNACRPKAAFAPMRSRGSNARQFGVMQPQHSKSQRKRGATKYSVIAGDVKIKHAILHYEANVRGFKCLSVRLIVRLDACANVCLCSYVALPLQGNFNVCGIGKDSSSQNRSLQTRALVVSEAVASIEEPAGNHGLNELESYVLDFEVNFKEKMAKVVKYFAKSPARSAVRLAEVGRKFCKTCLGTFLTVKVEAYPIYVSEDTLRVRSLSMSLSMILRIESIVCNHM